MRNLHVGSGAGGISPQGCNQHQKLGLGQLCGGLFMSFWLTFYLQLTKEQTSILLQVCESCISCKFLGPLRGHIVVLFSYIFRWGYQVRNLVFLLSPSSISLSSPVTIIPVPFFLILFNSALTGFEHILNKDWSSKAPLGTV